MTKGVQIRERSNLINLEYFSALIIAPSIEFSISIWYSWAILNHSHIVHCKNLASASHCWRCSKKWCICEIFKCQEKSKRMRKSQANDMVVGICPGVIRFLYMDPSTCFDSQSRPNVKKSLNSIFLGKRLAIKMYRRVGYRDQESRIRNKYIHRCEWPNSAPVFDNFSSVCQVELPHLACLPLLIVELLFFCLWLMQGIPGQLARTSD